MKHSGKTSLGRGLSAKISSPFFDTDEIIENNTNMKVRDLFKNFGEEAFQQAEIEACKYLLEQKNYHESLVISTGGGICDNKVAIDILKQIGTFVLLEVPEKTCLIRIMNNSRKTGSLPAYISKENPKNYQEIEDIFHKFYIRRMEAYKQIADFTFQPSPMSYKKENISNFINFINKIFML